MSKINLLKELAASYSADQTFRVLEIPRYTYLMIDGEGDPNTSQQYADSVAALYALSYGLKFMSKKELDRDYVVPPLEGLWWAEDMSSFHRRNKAEWRWTMMQLVPDWISGDLYAEVYQSVMRKKPLALLDRVRKLDYQEGLCVQILHIGSYDDEAATLAHLYDEWLPAHGYRLRGKHHEIYLSDPRRVAPEKLKTILRQPIAPVAADLKSQ